VHSCLALRVWGWKSSPTPGSTWKHKPEWHYSQRVSSLSYPAWSTTSESVQGSRASNPHHAEGMFLVSSCRIYRPGQAHVNPKPTQRGAKDLCHNSMWCSSVCLSALLRVACSPGISGRGRTVVIAVRNAASAAVFCSHRARGELAGDHVVRLLGLPLPPLCRRQCTALGLQFVTIHDSS
jgi:hypothetical protein